MASHTIKIPRTLDLKAALGMTVDLASIDDASAFYVDFDGVGTVEPFAMLVVSSELQRAAARNPGSTFECRNYERMTYAAHMGFFQAFGYDVGRQPGSSTGGSRHLPVNIFDCEKLREQAYQEHAEVGDIVETKSKHLAAMLCDGDVGDLFETLSYSLREIMRNVVEHSDSRQMGICAQYWPSKHRVEAAIIDRGVGVAKTLVKNPHLDVSDDKAALNYALMPAVSGKAYKGGSKQRGPWANSGFGLYMTSRICRNGGSFFIASGQTGMMLTKAMGGKSYFNCNYQGTAVRLGIRTDQIGSLAESLRKFREDGFEIQRLYREIVDINPSAASLMLSEDFDLSIWDKFLAALKIKR